jgi:hypothetical protein
VTKPKYTLEGLEKLRDGQVDEAKKKLADALRAREAATTKRQVAEQKNEAHQRAADRVRQAERVALEEGSLRARDLALQSSWEIGVRTEADRLALEVSKRKEEEQQATQREAEARVSVALKKADAEVVHKDHERFDARVRKAEEAKEEEAAEEAWRPKH